MKQNQNFQDYKDVILDDFWNKIDTKNRMKNLSDKILLDNIRKLLSLGPGLCYYEQKYKHKNDIQYNI